MRRKPNIASIMLEGGTVFVFQNRRDLELYVEEFLDICHLAICDDVCLMEGFLCRLDEDLRFVMPCGDRCWTLEAYINFALWMNGFAFTAVDPLALPSASDPLVPPLPIDLLTPPWLLPPPAPPETLTLTAPLDSLVPPAPPRSVVNLPMPLTCEPFAVLRLSTPTASAGSFLPLTLPQSSVTPAPPQSLGTQAPPRMLITAAPPKPPASAVLPNSIGSPSSPWDPLRSALSPSVIPQMSLATPPPWLLPPSMPPWAVVFSVL
ncbi:Filamentous hemagglutinin [Labeo rohita]|uniref:Filamentous hemagglutinin n=1 Tax=Labeo rohita TaxID=84645 RepID=A0ABQ8L1D1_LABRO|nr:Filamentous hemagglutinin [Labeo rohita]